MSIQAVVESYLVMYNVRELAVGVLNEKDNYISK